MSGYLLPLVVTVLAWWGTTGLIAYLDGLPRRTFPASLAASTVVLLLSLGGLALAARDATPAGAYLGFAAALGAWCWIELSFLTGYVTGPRRTACAPGCGGARHVRHAIEAILWHELAIVALVLVAAALTAGGENPVGLATLLLLWVMRSSAKLNLHFGVPNLGEAFLPEHLRYLASFFRRRRMNLLFPFSVTAGTVLVVLLAQGALQAADPYSLVAGTLLATLAALAVLEHWLMVLPLPSEALWRWSLGARAGGERSPLRYAGDAPP